MNRSVTFYMLAIMYKMYIIYIMKTYTSTEIRKKFSAAYNSVRYLGEPVKISHHGDESVVMLRVADVYPEPTVAELHKVAAYSGAFDEEANDDPSYD